MTDVLAWEDEIVEIDPAQVEAERLRKIDQMPLRKMVDEFRDGTADGRAVADQCTRYYNGDQVYGSRLTALTRSRQPKVIRNEITPAVNGILGIIQQAKVDPRAYPRNPGNEEQADAASKALRYVADKNRWHTTKVNAAEDFLVQGICAVMVEVDESSDPLTVHVPYDELIYDPHSRKPDFSDTRYRGVGKWMYESDVRSMYPIFADDLTDAFSTTWGADMGLDRPDKPVNGLANNWTDPKNRRLFIVEMYHLEDVWTRSVFYVGGVLEQGPSPYLDEDGEPVCALVMGSCFITNDNQRCGVVKAMLSPQDELNSYGSRALHLARSRQIQAMDKDNPPEVDGETAKREAAKPDGAIPWGWTVVPTADLMQGMQIMMADARQTLVRQAPTPAVLADASASNQSGRSRLVLQQAGMTEIARPLGRLEDWENEVYRQEWMRLKQFKQDAWWVRISGDDGKTEFVGFNVPTDQEGNEIPPEIAQQMAQAGMQPPQVKNQLARMDVDIEVETIPDTANLQAEQFEAIAPMLPMLAEAKGPEAAFKVGLALSSFPDKMRVKEIIEKPEDLSPEEQQQQAQMAQMQQQLQQKGIELQMAEMEAKIQKLQSEAAKNMASAAGTEADTVLKAAQFELGQPIDAS